MKDMKKVLLISVLAVLGLNTALTQEKIKWYSIEDAVQLASEVPKVLVIDVYTDWCGWCKRMDATTFSDPDIIKMMNTHFYPVKLNAEGKADIVIGERTFKFVQSGQRGYHEVAAIVTKGQLSYPTISYVDDQGRILEAARGFRTPEQFKVHLSYYAGEAYKTQSFQEFSEAFQNDL
jgi:thioredoxin-related protein